MRQYLAIGAAVGALLAVMQGIASAAPDSLIALAAAKFPNLTRAERAMLVFAQAGNVERGQFAVAGSSANPDDPSNDPKHAGEWDKQREIRAQLIRWLCEDRQAMQLVGPGVGVLGATIVGELNLDGVQPPFGISLIKCEIPGRISLAGAHLRWLVLSGSYTGQIYAPLMISEDVLVDGVHSTGELCFESSKIDGLLHATGAHFRHGPRPLPGGEAFASWNLAVNIAHTNIRSSVTMDGGFEADGAVLVLDSSIGGEFSLVGSRFINPNNYALKVDSVAIGGTMILSTWINPENPMPAQFDGIVSIVGDEIHSFFADQAIFMGAAQSDHGLQLFSDSIKGTLFLDAIELRNGATLDLTGTSTHILFDDEKGWPERGKLFIDGFTYGQLAANNDADTRLRWLALQDGFHVQPYRQLANYLRQIGDQRGAVKVLVAEEDARYARTGPASRLWGHFLKITVGYGHEPLRTVLWSIAVIVLGWMMVTLGARAGVMRLTWPETTPPPAGNPTDGLHPLLYSLDVFLPFVNLHQEHYWWPDESASGEYRFFGGNITMRGSILRYYLWLQIIAGWLLSAIFVAGVTGLMRSD